MPAASTRAPHDDRSTSDTVPATDTVPTSSERRPRRRRARLAGALAALAVVGLAACGPLPESGDRPWTQEELDAVLDALANGAVPTAEGAPDREYLGEFKVYCYAQRGGTASGQPVGPNVVAVDPRVIPLWSNIEIEGVGWRTALDTGGAIKGHTLDIWNASNAWCNDFGVQYLDVWIAR